MREEEIAELRRLLERARALIRECRLADRYAARTGDDRRWVRAFHEPCAFERAAIERIDAGEPFIFTVHGRPRPQPRPRFFRGRAISTADPKARLWRLGVDRAIRAAIASRGDATPLFTGPVRMRCIFTFAPPSGAQDRLGTPHTHKPDASNLLKLIEDVAEQAGVFANDSKVAKPAPEKWWGLKPGVTVIVESMAGETRPEPPRAVTTAPGWLSGNP